MLLLEENTLFPLPSTSDRSNSRTVHSYVCLPLNDRAEKSSFGRIYKFVKHEFGDMVFHLALVHKFREISFDKRSKMYYTANPDNTILDIFPTNSLKEPVGIASLDGKLWFLY